VTATTLDRLIRRLDLRTTDADRYIGGAGAGGVTADDRLFGGLVVAQATVAAARTVDEFFLHSMHAYFLRPGRAERDIEFRVERSKQGRNFHVRSVHAWQGEQLILQLQASFSRGEQGVHHQNPMPSTPRPADLPNRDELRGRANWQRMPLDLRMATQITGTQPLPAKQNIWLRPTGPLPKDPVVHLGLLVYASDRTLLETAWRPHCDLGELAGASLDHSLWLHRQPQMDDWHLYTMESPAAAGGRGLVHGAIYDAAGKRICSVAQEGVLRIR
jgi:acyl-CoA thioesterase-2